MVTPENLDQVLFALKNAGVRRARFGDVEFEFEPEVPEATETAPQIVELAPSTLPQDGEAVPLPYRPKAPGYAALFREGGPRFRPVEG